MAVYKSNKPTKDGRQYFFRIKYKDIFGESRDYTSKKFKNLKEAKQEEALYRIKIQKQEISTSSITFEQIINEYMLYKSKSVKKQSLIKINDKMNHIRILNSIKINNFDLNKYNVFRSKLENLHLSITYSNKIISLLKAIINYSNKYYNTSNTILKFIEPFKDTNTIKKEMLFFTYDEYKQFDSVITNFMHHTFFETLYFLGLRQGEAQALTWNDISFNKEELNITKTLTTKIKGEKWTISTPKTKGSIRILPIPKTLLNDLKKLKSQAQSYKDFSNNWFVFGNSVCFPENTIQLNKNKYCKLAGVKQIRIHDFRHSCASLLINKGANITLVSKYLGHSNITITLNTYTHMYKSELEQISKVIDNL